MIFVKPLKDVFPSLEKDVNYSSLFGSYAKAKESGWYWIKQQFGYETKGLLKELKKNGMPVDIESLSFGIMGGAILCRTFLERYAAKPVSSHSNDEVRFSIYSAAFGITLKNNGILDNVDAGKNLFNAENEELFEKDIDHVIAQGGDVIHPIRHVIEGLNEKIG